MSGGQNLIWQMDSPATQSLPAASGDSVSIMTHRDGASQPQITAFSISSSRVVTTWHYGSHGILKQAWLHHNDCLFKAETGRRIWLMTFGGSMGTKPKITVTRWLGHTGLGTELCIHKSKSLWPGQRTRGKNKQQTCPMRQSWVMRREGQNGSWAKSPLTGGILGPGTIEKPLLGMEGTVSWPVNIVFPALPPNYPHGTSPFLRLSQIKKHCPFISLANCVKPTTSRPSRSMQ